MNSKINRSQKKTLNRNPFNEKLLHRFYLEALYFYSDDFQKKKLIPDGLGDEIKTSNLILVVPEDSSRTNQTGYRQDFSLYFKGYKPAIPVEIKWKSSDFKAEHQVGYIKNNNGFLVVLHKDVEVEVPCVEIEPEYFQEWMAQRIFTLTGDSLASKGISAESSTQWLVALRGDQPKGPLDNFKRMRDATKQYFWAFANNAYGKEQIFDLKKGDKMVFLFFKSGKDRTALKIDSRNRKIDIFGWAEVQITDPYYICLEGEQADFFEQKGEQTNVSDRKWVHFIDFNILNEKFGTKNEPIILNTVIEGSLNDSVVKSANNGGVLTPIPQSVYNTLSGTIKTKVSEDEN